MVEKKFPHVFDYLDAAFFLQDYYKARKKNSPNFSYETWSNELGLQSRSFIRLIVLGKKKISAKLLESLASQCFETKPEAEYFHFLVQYSQAPSAKDKQIFGSKLMQFHKRNTRQQNIDSLADFVSSPLLPRLVTLLSFQDITPNLGVLSTLIDQSEEKTSESLHKLVDLGLAKKEIDEKGEVLWKSEHKNLKVQDRLGSIDLMKFHEQSLLDAIDAFHLPKELRRYKSLLLPMSEEELRGFYERMDGFASEEFAKLSVDELKGRRLFQINLNVHPVGNKPSQN